MASRSMTASSGAASPDGDARWRLRCANNFGMLIVRVRRPSDDGDREARRLLLTRTSRRSFLARTTMTATALSVAPVDFLLRPGSAYAADLRVRPRHRLRLLVARAATATPSSAAPSTTALNACPPGTFAGGWWKADGSIYCAGPRYYIDCMGECHGCGCGGGSFCPSCDGLVCECALGSCNNRHVGCTEFRYGQCHQEIACSGRISCRVVSCTPPWLLDSTCSTVAQTDDSTANHFAPCRMAPPGGHRDARGHSEHRCFRHLALRHQFAPGGASWYGPGRRDQPGPGRQRHPRIGSGWAASGAVNIAWHRTGRPG